MTTERRRTYVVQILAGDGNWSDVSEWTRPHQASDEERRFLADHLTSKTRIISRIVIESEIEKPGRRSKGLMLHRVTRTWYIEARSAMEALTASQRVPHDEASAKLTIGRPPVT